MKLRIIALILLLASVANAQYVRDFKDKSDADITIDSTSYAFKVAGTSYDGTPYAIQIYDSSSASGTIQGILAKDNENADDLTDWQNMTDGTISADGFFHIFGPVTHIRINMASGSCKARIMY